MGVIIFLVGMSIILLVTLIILIRYLVHEIKIVSEPPLINSRPEPIFSKGRLVTYSFLLLAFGIVFFGWWFAFRTGLVFNREKF